MAAKKKRVFVGDIQGCLDELKLLLKTLSFDSDTHELFCVGDVVNRGPQSAATIRYLISLGAHSVLGNHELHLISVASGQRAAKPRDTFSDVLTADDRDELISWVKSCPLIRVWDDIILVHAGLPADYKQRLIEVSRLEKQIKKGQVPWHDALTMFFTTVRLCNQKGKQELGYRPFEDFKAWNEFYHDKPIVVCGHWAERGVLQTKNLRAIDSGCVWGKKLTAWVAEDDKFYSVDALEAYQTVQN